MPAKQNKEDSAMVLIRSMFAVILVVCSPGTSAQPIATSFVSDGVDIPAFLQRTGDGEPRAVVINLHGNPGARIRAESALATHLSTQGVDTFWFNYRGIWGNPGSYSLTNGIGDLRAAIDFLKGADARKRFGLGNAPIILTGYSFGSAVALLGAAADDRVAGVVAYAPCDLGYFGQELANPQSRIKKFIDEGIEGIFGPKGPVPGGGPAFTGDLITNLQSNAFPRIAPALQKKALLFLAGRDDVVCPVEDHFFPLYRALRSAQHPQLDAHILNTGHAFDRATATTLNQMTAAWILQSFPSHPTKGAAIDSPERPPKLPRP
ncbi:MAG: alpha/beta fold hydrolase [Betaproteobacteria bacterium]